jgi:hypothetical protein
MWRFVQFGNNAEWQNRVLTNRNVFLEEDSGMCIASECMMWTWDKTEYEYSGGKVDDSGWEEVAVGCWRKKRENREGFCGFGGSR